MGRDSYQRRDVGQSATSICSTRRQSSMASICLAWHRSSVPSICLTQHRGSAGLMRRSSSVDDLVARRSSSLDLLRCWHHSRRQRRGQAEAPISGGWDPQRRWGETLLSTAQHWSKRGLDLLGAASVKRGLDLLDVALVKHGLDLLSVALGQRGVDEKELQHR
jgi:hypothetical protein